MYIVYTIFLLILVTLTIMAIKYSRSLNITNGECIVRINIESSFKE